MFLPLCFQQEAPYASAIWFDVLLFKTLDPSLLTVTIDYSFCILFLFLEPITVPIHATDLQLLVALY
jgi:hypothetical protein